MHSRWPAARAFAVWVVATAVGIAVSWFGVRPVLDAAVPDRLVAFPVPDEPAEVSVEPVRPGSPSASRSFSPSASPSPSRSSARTSDAASPSPPTIDGWTPVGDGRYVRSFRMVGGDATVQAQRGRVELLSATPRAGFVVTVTPTAADRVVVNFTGLLRYSTLEVVWVDAEPAVEVTEFP